MPATIQDVADQAGVSTATVSRALRGLPNVSPDTRNQVIHVAERLNYQITPHVSRMARGRRVVGIVVPLADQWFYSKLVSIAELELMRQDCDVARYSVESVAGQESLLQHLTARKLVDGLILCSLSLSDQTTEIVGKAGIAVATIETTRPELPSVYIDNGAAAELGARHLINLGHRNIAIITGISSSITTPAVQSEVETDPPTSSRKTPATPSAMLDSSQAQGVSASSTMRPSIPTARTKPTVAISKTMLSNTRLRDCSRPSDRP